MRHGALQRGGERRLERADRGARLPPLRRLLQHVVGQIQLGEEAIVIVLLRLRCI